MDPAERAESAGPAGTTGPGEPTEHTGPTDLVDPTDPDIDLSVPAQRRELTHGQGLVLAAVALGGGIGASARYAASLLWPGVAGGFPWTTLVVNAVGCAAIGVLMVLVAEARTARAHPLLRPFLGTGVLGGFTTFSTYAVDIERLVSAGRARTGLVYLALTLLTALAAVCCAAWTTRRLLARRAS
ncbi:fluoride efflux transporter CrcB [Streptomyces sp. NPDC041068]|uniref:fluoride efflux transporter CrcB n=1 Tax=Streptomyces sp. NPDC041068 TaxID=3155130 RepID=UPI0033E2EFF2